MGVQPTDAASVRRTDGRTDAAAGGGTAQAAHRVGIRRRRSFVRSFVRRKSTHTAPNPKVVVRPSFVVRRRSSSKHAHTPRIHTSSSSKDTS